MSSCGMRTIGVDAGRHSLAVASLLAPYTISDLVVLCDGRVPHALDRERPRVTHRQGRDSRHLQKTYSCESCALLVSKGFL